MPAPESNATDPAQLRDRYLTAQLAGDRREALRLVMEDGIRSGIPAADIYLDVLQPAQVEIGRRWQANEITVAQEHVATAISQVVVSNLYAHLERAAPNGRRVVVACAEGERHELGARMAADFLEMAGFSVLFLGADVPARDVADTAARAGADLIVLSCATSLCFPGLQRTLTHIRERLGDAVPVAVGGTAFSYHERCTAPGVIDAGHSAADLVATARRVTRVELAA